MAKSAAKQDLSALYDELVSLARPFEKQFAIRQPKPGQYHLWAEGEMELNGKSYKEMFFIGIQTNKSAVVIHYLPLYVDPDLKKRIDPDLVKLLKGKSCFHIKKLDDTLKKSITSSFKIGVDFFRKKNWI